MDFIRRYFRTKDKKYRNSPTIYVNLNWDFMGAFSKAYSPKVTIPGNKFYVLFNDPGRVQPDIDPPYPGENTPNEGPLPEVPLLGVIGLIDLGPPPEELEQFFANLPLPPTPDIATEDQEGATAAATAEAAAASPNTAQVSAAHAAVQAAELLAEVQGVPSMGGLHLPDFLPMIDDDEAQNLVVTGTAIELQPGVAPEEEGGDASDISIHQSNISGDDTTSSSSDEEDYLLAEAAVLAYHAHHLILRTFQRTLAGIVPRMSQVSSSDSSSSPPPQEQQRSTDEGIAGYSGGVKDKVDEQAKKEEVGEDKETAKEVAALTIQQVISAAFDRLAATTDRRASGASTSMEEPKEEDPIPQEFGAGDEGDISSTEKEESDVGVSGEEPQPGFTE